MLPRRALPVGRRAPASLSSHLLDTTLVQCLLTWEPRHLDNRSQRRRAARQRPVRPDRRHDGMESRRCSPPSWSSPWFRPLLRRRSWRPCANGSRLGQHQQVVAVTLNDNSAPALVYLVAQSHDRLKQPAPARARLRTAGRSARDRPVALHRSLGRAERPAAGPGGHRRRAGGRARSQGGRGTLSAGARAGGASRLRQSGAGVRGGHRDRPDAGLRALLCGALVLSGETGRP